MAKIFEFTTADKPHAPLLIEASIEQRDDGTCEYYYKLNDKPPVVGEALNKFEAGMCLIDVNSNNIKNVSEEASEKVTEISYTAALLEDALFRSVLYDLDKY